MSLIMVTTVFQGVKHLWERDIYGLIPRSV